MVFKTDDKPWESSWELLDQEGLVVASRDSFTEPYLLHIDTVYIASPGCHKLILHDSGGDGIETYFAIESWKNGGWRSMFYTKDFYFTSTCQINITKAAPLAAFEAENIHTCEGDNVQFFNTTNGTTDSIEWHFEGGIPETSNLLNPEVVYPNAGSFDVSLKIWSDFYCDTLIKENYISVFPYPEVQFSEIPDQCVNWPPLQLTQGWPEGGVYSGEFVENGYFYPQLAGVGDHGIKYVYTNAGGCADSTLQNVRVDACVGIADAQDQPHLSIYPNPVGKAAYLNMTLAEEGIARIELIDLQNRCIPLYDGWCRAEQPVGIDLKDLKLNPGIYVLRVNTGATVFYQKVIIK